jgi:hypothetical protein
VHFKPTKCLDPEHLQAHTSIGCGKYKMHEPLLSARRGQGIGGSRLTKQHGVMAAQCDDGHVEVTSDSRHFIAV